MVFYVIRFNVLLYCYFVRCCFAADSTKPIFVRASLHQWIYLSVQARNQICGEILFEFSLLFPSPISKSLLGLQSVHSLVMPQGVAGFRGCAADIAGEAGMVRYVVCLDMSDHTLLVAAGFPANTTNPHPARPSPHQRTYLRLQSVYHI